MVKQLILALAFVALLAPALLGHTTSEGATKSPKPSMGSPSGCADGMACDSAMNCGTHCSAATITSTPLEPVGSRVVTTSVPLFSPQVAFAPLDKPPPRFA